LIEPGAALVGHDQARGGGVHEAETNQVACHFAADAMTANECEQRGAQFGFVI
jgi:hypothetical protein